MRDSRGAVDGLAPLTSANPGMLIAYSTGTGEVAENRAGKMSIYTEALVKALGIPDESLTTIFRRVRAEVVSAPGYSDASNPQSPELSDSLNEDIFLRPLAKSEEPRKQ